MLLDLTDYYENFNLSSYAQDMRITILKWIGLPCCVGIGSSKTEAKIANHIAKKYPAFNSVCNLVDMDLCNKEAFFLKLMLRKCGESAVNIVRNCRGWE